MKVVIAADRGGHVHDALELVKGMSLEPAALLTTAGPELATHAAVFPRVHRLPYLFTWWRHGRRRFLNPFKVAWSFALSLLLAARLRPTAVVSLGASSVVFFCYWARLFGARIYHVECMNQVTTRSLTGRLLYPVCFRLYVQWEECLPLYGHKACYAGWVLRP